MIIARTAAAAGNAETNIIGNEQQQTRHKHKVAHNVGSRKTLIYATYYRLANHTMLLAIPPSTTVWRRSRSGSLDMCDMCEMFYYGYRTFLLSYHRGRQLSLRPVRQIDGGRVRSGATVQQQRNVVQRQADRRQSHQQCQGPQRCAIDRGRHELSRKHQCDDQSNVTIDVCDPIRRVCIFVPH
jgi:hypothetical protein